MGHSSLDAPSLLRDLPDVPGRVAERRVPHAPRRVYRAVEQLDAAAPQLVAHRVDVVDGDRELEPRAGLRLGDRRGRDQLRRLTDLEEVDQRVAELEDRRVVVLERDRQAERLLVEGFRRGEVLDEERDRADGLRPGGDVGGWHGRPPGTGDIGRRWLSASRAPRHSPPTPKGG